tara:strand:- start:584 stop:892 length:309 start_codon:yes stop_codon:yes gene_type:complete
LKSRKNKRPKYWSNWREDSKLSSIVASYEIFIGDRLSVVSFTNTGAPIMEIVSPKKALRKNAKKAGMIYGRWPTQNGGERRGWIPGRPDEPLETNPYLIEKR